MNTKRRNVLTAALLLSAFASACTVGVNDSNSPEEQPASEELSELAIEENKDLGQSVNTDDIDLSVNEAPCGEKTIAVITDERAATYAFCASPGGDTGPMVFEYLPSDSMLSLLDEETDIAAMFARVVPEDAEVPNWVAEALRSGVHTGGESPFIAKAQLQEGMIALSGSGSCADPQSFFDHAYDIMFPSFFHEFVYFGGGANYTVRSCVREHDFQHQSYSTSQRTASAYTHTANGACAGAARLRSCGGYTGLRGQWRPGTSGAWSQYFFFWVPSGGLGKTKYYANPQHSCHPTRDKDDVRFRGESVPGAYHHFTATFIGRTDTVGGGAVCYTDPV